MMEIAPPNSLYHLSKSYLIQLASEFRSSTQSAINCTPRLDNIWYLAAASTFTACNEPQEIPKLYHFALLRESNLNKGSLSDVVIAERVMKLFEKDRPTRIAILDEWYSKPNRAQVLITQRFQETILKSSSLTGLPKAINSLQKLAEEIPRSFQIEQPRVLKDEKDYNKLFPNVMRDIHMSKEEVVKRGMDCWNSIYSTTAEKVTNNINKTYPDLWYFIMAHVYGPILSHTAVLSSQETSLIIIAALVPQDVNAQLWGHMKGAINIGCDKHAIERIRMLSIAISKYCGAKWKEGVAKL
ncbi:HDL326Cp [Eremothecium sinecaudum]|uniref:HDL326Cp n=1 Tax=Eremothecium sinecaudum TaxID=45286 RepID=A0A120K248_9SACH|nr:HDL326Cp [Eremothecium sinecaudum]AMD20418.1 HDL326Cp [Eremothecium sinecaudum]